MKRKLPFSLALVLTVLLVACSLFGQRVTIGENERGVVADDQGNLQVLLPGTHALSPFAGEAVIYPMTDQIYTMTGQPEAAGIVAGNDAIEARSRDGGLLWIDSTVTFRFVESKLTDVHKLWNSPKQFLNAFIRPTARNAVYNTVGQYNYKEVISSKRNEFEAAISQQLAEEFAKQGAELVKFSLLDVRGE